MRQLINKQNVFEQTEAELSHFDRIGKINRLLDEQSEISQNGIVIVF